MKYLCLAYGDEKDWKTHASSNVTPNERHGAQKTPTVGPEHRRLDVFVGKWNVVGENRDGAPLAANTKVTGEESYEWMPGGFFLVCRWDRRFGNDRHTGMGVIGYDAESREYSSHNFDNLGFDRTYRMTERDRVWTFTGQWERAAYVIADDADTMTIHWEVTKDGSTWLPLCDLTATKVT